MNHVCCIFYPRNANQDVVIVQVTPSHAADIGMQLTSSDKSKDAFIRITDDFKPVTYYINLGLVGSPEFHSHEESVEECPISFEDEYADEDKDKD